VGLIRVSHPGWIVAGVKAACRRRCTPRPAGSWSAVAHWTGLVCAPGPACAASWPWWVFTTEGFLQHNRELIELRALPGLGPAGRAAHVSDAQPGLARAGRPRIHRRLTSRGTCLGSPISSAMIGSGAGGVFAWLRRPRAGGGLTGWPNGRTPGFSRPEGRGGFAAGNWLNALGRRSLWDLRSGTGDHPCPADAVGMAGLPGQDEAAAVRFPV
jgi:hypothetical protein